MYILKNALISIKRNKGRNLLIGVIIVVIACATTITLAIRSSAKSLIESYESKYDVKATIGINRETMRNEMKPSDNVTTEERENIKESIADKFSLASSLKISDIENYGDSKYVTDYYYQISVGVNSENIEKATTETEDNMQGRETKSNFQNISSSDFILMGYSSLSAMEEFISGKYKVSDGQIPNDLESMNCVINAELATLNNIKVGDTITFVDPDNANNKISLIVTGIFEETDENTETMGMFTTSVNTIITNTNVVNKLSLGNENIKTSLTPTFILTNKSVIEKFEKELTEKGLSEYLSVSTNLDQVESATSTVSNVNTFATTFLIITLIIGGIVLFVINMINIRERKYEIGVLRTIGMKKRNLTFQFISELLIIAIISLLIGAGLGAISSVPVSNYLLENEISSTIEQKENINQNFGNKGNNKNFDRINGVANIEAIDSIDAVVDFKVLLQLLIIGIVLTLISSSASMISIQKFSPLTILKERS